MVSRSWSSVQTGDFSFISKISKNILLYQHSKNNPKYPKMFLLKFQNRYNCLNYFLLNAINPHFNKSEKTEMEKKLRKEIQKSIKTNKCEIFAF